MINFIDGPQRNLHQESEWMTVKQIQQKKKKEKKRLRQKGLKLKGCQWPIKVKKEILK